MQVIDWKDSSPEVTYNVLMGTLNPTQSLTHGADAHSVEDARPPTQYDVEQPSSGTTTSITYCQESAIVK